MNRPLVGALALGASVLLLAGCASSGSTPSDGGSAGGKPINVLVLFGETGATAAYSKAYVNGVTSAVAAINADGGVDGRKLVANIVDDGTDPTKAVSLVTAALNSSTPPDIIVPGATSAEALALTPLLTSKKIFAISGGSSPLLNDPAKYPYFFGQSAGQAEANKVLTTEFESKKYTKIAVLASADAFGDSILAGIQQVAKDAGVKIIDTERPSATQLDYTVELQRMQASKPDALFFDMQIPDATGRVLTARDTVGAGDIPIYGGTAAGSVVVSSLVSASATDNCQLPVYSFTVDGKGGSYLAPMYKKFVGGTSGVFSGGLGWDTMSFIAQAVHAAKGKTDGPSLATALQADGVPADKLALFPGGTSFSATNHFPLVTKGSRSLVPCSSTVTDGLWITK